MGLETFTGKVSDLVPANPSGTDPKSQGDDHLRGIKTTIIGQSINCQLGQSSTPAHNFTLTAAADDSTMKLARGNAVATTQDIMTVDTAGKVGFSIGILGFEFSFVTANSYILFPSWAGSLLIQWGQQAVDTGSLITLPKSFATTAYALVPTASNATGSTNVSGSFAYESATPARTVNTFTLACTNGVRSASWFAIGKGA